jgi:hypothetical protein
MREENSGLQDFKPLQDLQRVTVIDRYASLV